MKKIIIVLITVILALPVDLFSQNQSDSLVSFSGIKFHSEFEQQALKSYIQNKKDTFNLFLAIDENMTTEIASGYRFIFNKVIAELFKQKIETKNPERKIRMLYSTLHNKFLKKYNENEYFPFIFKEGTYNCVSASLLFSLVFDQLKIPYKVMASKSHIYLIANPGNNSIVIETTNPAFENSIFNGDFKEQYVTNLRKSKLISEDDFKSKSIEEIFATRFNELTEVKVSNLPGFQYYNMALTKAVDQDIDKAYDLAQKAYYFYPDQQVKTLFYSALAYKLNKCEFNKMEDVDLLTQYAKLDPSNTNQITRIFDVMLAKNLQYTDRSKNIESYYQRLKSQISNQSILEEIGFNYYMTRAYSKKYDLSGSAYFARQALKFKPNHKDAISLFEACLQNDLQGTDISVSYLDSLNSYDKELNNEDLSSIISEHKNLLYLKIAKRAFSNKNIVEGEKYLSLFENNFKLPFKKPDMKYTLENAYYEYAAYYAHKKNKAMVEKIISRGLKLVPNSNMIQSARDNYPIRVITKMQVVRN